MAVTGASAPGLQWGGHAPSSNWHAPNDHSTAGAKEQLDALPFSVLSLPFIGLPLHFHCLSLSCHCLYTALGVELHKQFRFDGAAVRPIGLHLRP